jgi:hypothetical protein
MHPYSQSIPPTKNFCIDFCPAHDSLPLRHYLIGITNPFFLKRLLSQGKENSQVHVVHLAGPEIRRKTSLMSYSTFIDRDNFSHLVSSQSSSNETKGYIAKDVAFLRKLETLLEDPETSSREISRFIRRHFALLAAFFLAPLNRYLTTLVAPMPPPSSPSSPSIAMIDMSRFSEQDFLSSLSKHGCSVHFKGKTSFHRHKNAEEFYRKFCASPGFFSWLDMKMRLSSRTAAEIEDGGIWVGSTTIGGAFGDGGVDGSVDGFGIPVIRSAFDSIP